MKNTTISSKGCAWCLQERATHSGAGLDVSFNVLLLVSINGSLAVLSGEKKMVSLEREEKCNNQQQRVCMVLTGEGNTQWCWACSLLDVSFNVSLLVSIDVSLSEPESPPVGATTSCVMSDGLQGTI